MMTTGHAIAILAFFIAFGVFAYAMSKSLYHRGPLFKAMREAGRRGGETPGDPRNPVLLKPVSLKVWAALAAVGMVLIAFSLVRSDYLADIFRGQAS